MSGKSDSDLIYISLYTDPWYVVDLLVDLDVALMRRNNVLTTSDYIGGVIGDLCDNFE